MATISWLSGNEFGKVLMEFSQINDVPFLTKLRSPMTIDLAMKSKLMHSNYIINYITGLVSFTEYTG